MIEMLWPTPVVIEDVGNEKLNAGIIEAQYLSKEHNMYSNFWDIDHPAVRELQGHFVRLGNLLAETKGNLPDRQPNQIEWTTERSWMNIQRRGDWTSPHNHGMAPFAGVYYVKAEGDCGDLLLQDPAGMTSWSNYIEDGKSGRVYKRIKSVTGRMIIFPGHIIHCTDFNNTDEERICIATNFRPAQ